MCRGGLECGSRGSSQHCKLNTRESVHFLKGTTHLRGFAIHPLRMLPKNAKDEVFLGGRGGDWGVVCFLSTRSVE